MDEYYWKKIALIMTYLFFVALMTLIYYVNDINQGLRFILILTKPSLVKNLFSAWLDVSFWICIFLFVCWLDNKCTKWNQLRKRQKRQKYKLK